ncbi:MAG: 50S ribosomal protein L29 [Planctomycetes bacterium]|nr:50S ribosomal protein L29 [Planctomycetota bacterium]
MKASELREMNPDELVDELENFKRRLFEIRTQAVTEKLEDPGQRETFITAALRALNDFRDPAPPVWCTMESDFRSHFNESADRWLGLHGNRRPTARASGASRLARRPWGGVDCHV